MLNKFIKLGAGVAIAVAALGAQAAFPSVSTDLSGIKAEVTRLKAASGNPISIATSAKAAGVGASSLAQALVDAGFPGVDVVNAIVVVYGESARSAAQGGAVLAGATPESVGLTSTAAGGDGAGAAGGFGGGGGSNFGGSLRSSFIGGAGGSRTTVAASRN